jgi:hypothetical protein
MNIILRTMSTLSERVREAVDVAKNRGHSIADIAGRCGISVQAVYQWLDPLNSLKEIKSSSLLGLADLSGFNPWYINDGIGDKILTYAKTGGEKALLKAAEPMNEDGKYKLARVGNTLSEHPGQGNGTQ